MAVITIGFLQLSCRALLDAYIQGAVGCSEDQSSHAGSALPPRLAYMSYACTWEGLSCLGMGRRGWDAVIFLPVLIPVTLLPAQRANPYFRNAQRSKKGSARDHTTFSALHPHIKEELSSHKTPGPQRTGLG